ncbi:hypothetical protein A4H97_10865 [Niastella yeongjuensis]|uniref:Uncharacterized protein n=1 Tax=Niastella yeongjuensis TaxID=354355 RepID=A0A1V9EFL0_9BACT|nr:hypothetical protein A4H97_10865 [Niastella yeongjuensis]SEP41942.1 hypothetical protein SAMN05660816_05926 [Niastella yeongjuensis]
MTHLASLQKSRSNGLKSPARVIPILHAGKKQGQNQGPKHRERSTVEFPQFNNERIFKPKQHDPL